MIDDRKLIADVLEHDRLLSSTDHPGLAAEKCCIDALDSAPELARRFGALLDALDDTAHLEAAAMEAFHHDDIGADLVKSIRAAYARNLERSKP